MKIYLKQNWSEQFIYGDGTSGYFVGRDHEVKALKNVITGNDSSAVLISSVRGVGKTSFVHKALSEMDSAHPVFVNIGHALANADDEAKNKKLLLVSLIRATYFHFGNDTKLTALYKRCFAKYKEEENESHTQETKKKAGITGELKTNAKTIIQLVAVILVVLGLTSESLVSSLLLGILGLVTLFLSVTWQKEWTNNLTNKKSTVIDNSTEYLEIEFENWLREQKDKKLVFVIDELDKIEETEAFKMIKEYKNLFNRSFAHFIFISSQRSFDLISEDREKDASEGGIYPTLFTHVFYLSLPKTEELKSYLDEVFESSTEVKQEDKDRLIHYLLFRSGNDFFELKRLISDVLCFDEEEKPFIDTGKIKEADPLFVRVAGLFEYVDQWYVQKHFRDLKKYWKENSDMQKQVFKFLNTNFNKNIEESSVEDSMKKLVKFLQDIGILKSVKSEVKPSVEVVVYQWTNKYNRNVKAPLLEEDEKFNKSFKALTKLANDLDDLPESYKTGKFDDYETVSENRDGQGLSGVNLFSIFSDYEGIYKKLKEPSQRISVTAEKTKEAREIIDEQIKNIFDKYFDISVNLLNKLFKSNTEVFKNENIDSASYNIKATFDALPEFLSVATPSAYDMKVYGRIDQTRYVLIIREFEDEESITKALSALKSRQDILIVNIVHGDNYRISHPKVFVDKLGRKRKNGAEVKNFVNVEFSDFRQLSSVFNKIEAHLI